MKTSAAILGLIGASGLAAAEPPPTTNASEQLSIELAGTLSGKTPDPTTGIRAAAIKTVASSSDRGGGTGLGIVGRIDRHGAPAQLGSMFETQALSYGIGLRGWLRTGAPKLRFTSYLEVTAGRTSARNDTTQWHHAGHTMVAVGFLLGPARSPVSGLFDFGWMFTKVGEDRIGPIASLGLSITLD